jgi:hypothetical protein
MFDFYKQRKSSEFVQEYAYIEDYSLFYEHSGEKELNNDSNEIIEIDLNNGKAIEII